MKKTTEIAAFSTTYALGTCKRRSHQNLDYGYQISSCRTIDLLAQPIPRNGRDLSLAAVGFIEPLYKADKRPMTRAKIHGINQAIGAWTVPKRSSRRRRIAVACLIIRPIFAISIPPFGHPATAKP